MSESDAETSQERASEYVKARAQDNSSALVPEGKRHSTMECDDFDTGAFVVELFEDDVPLFDECEVCH